MPDPTPTPTPTPTPAPAWYEGKATPEMLGFWQNKSYNATDPHAVAIEATKAAMQAQQFIGAPADQLIRLPKDAADEAGWKGVYSRLGVPGDAKEYDFASIKMPDGKDLEPAFVDTMRAALHKANVGKDRAVDVVKAVLKHQTDAAMAEAATTTAKRAAEREALLKNWGNNAEFNRLQAMQGAKRLGVTEEDIARFEATIGYDRTLEIFRRIGAGTTEDTFVDGKQDGSVTTATGASSRKEELMRDTDWAKRYLAGGSKEVQEMAALNALITGAAA